MIVYHVTSKKKFLRCLERGGIKPPVRAWVDIKDAEMFSIQTGRTIILRLKFPDNTQILEGHMGKAVFYDKIYDLINY